METQNSAPDARELKEASHSSRGRDRAPPGPPRVQTDPRSQSPGGALFPPRFSASRRAHAHCVSEAPPPKPGGVRAPQSWTGTPGGRKPCGPWTGNCALKSRPTQSFRTTREGAAKCAHPRADSTPRLGPPASASPLGLAIPDLPPLPARSCLDPALPRVAVHPEPVAGQPSPTSPCSPCWRTCPRISLTGKFQSFM